MTKTKNDPRAVAEFCAREAEERKAADIVSLKVSELTTIADYFVLCTAQSEPQMKALSSWLQKRVFEEFKIKPSAVDGESVSKWVLIDFGNVIIHIMTPGNAGALSVGIALGRCSQTRRPAKVGLDRNKNRRSI